MVVDLEESFAGYKHVPKVWGHEVWLCNQPQYCAKLLVLDPGMQCSLHSHPVKDETFFVLEGDVYITLGQHAELKGPGDCVHVPPGTIHRFACPITRGAVLLEVSTEHSDSDVVRLEESGPIKEF